MPSVYVLMDNHNTIYGLYQQAAHAKSARTQMHIPSLMIFSYVPQDLVA